MPVPIHTLMLWLSCMLQPQPLLISHCIQANLHADELCQIVQLTKASPREVVKMCVKRDLQALTIIITVNRVQRSP